MVKFPQEFGAAKFEGVETGSDESERTAYIGLYVQKCAHELHSSLKDFYSRNLNARPSNYGII